MQIKIKLFHLSSIGEDCLFESYNRLVLRMFRENRFSSCDVSLAEERKYH